MSQEKTGADADNKATFTKDDVEKMVSEAVTATKTEFQDHIKKLNEENKKHRLDAKGIKGLLAETLGLKEGEKTDADILKEKLAEIATQNKELSEKFEKSEKEKIQLTKEKEATEALEKAGFQKKAIKLIDLNGDVDTQIKQLESDYPELKGKKDIGTGSNPPITNSVTSNPYKKESFNLTLQGKLNRENPVLANKLKAEAGLR